MFTKWNFLNESRGLVHQIRTRSAVGAQQSGLGKAFRSWISFATVAAFVVYAPLPSLGSLVTDPTPGLAGSSTSVSISGSPIREGAVLSAGATATIGTSALLNPGLGNREIRTSYDSHTVYQAGSAQAPEGWTLQYSIDHGDNWVNSEPSPASSVTDIRATKTNVAAGAIDGYSQEYSSETVSSIPSSTFSASTGGDGWGVDFYENYVINIYHHANSTVFECKLKSTGQLCQNGVTNTTIRSPLGADYYASNRSDLAVDQEAGRAYVITGQSNQTTDTTDPAQYTTGVLCIDLTALPASWCGFTPLSEAQGPTAYYGYGDIIKYGTKYYSAVGYSSNSPKLYCFDATTQTNCAGSPMAITGNGFGASPPRLKLSGDKLFIKSASNLACVSADDFRNKCSGAAWTTGVSVGNYDTDIAVHTDSAGNEDGVCVKETTAGCFDYEGVSKPTWTNPWTVLGIGGSQYSRGVTVLGRYYITNFSTRTVYCVDYRTGATCRNADNTAAFSGLTTSNWYMVEVDPENPACLWANSDARMMANFDAWSGLAGCASNPVITLQPSQFAPRYACSTSNGIDQWKTLRISSLVGGGTASGISLTVRDGQGRTVSGWSNKAVTLDQPLDMTTLDVLSSSSRPTFSFAFSNVQGTISSATIALEYKGKGPELCSTVIMATPAQATDITVNGYLIDSVTPAGTYQSQRNFSIDPAAQASSVYQTVPNAPANLSGTGLNTSATITFTPPTDNGGLELTGYQYSLDNGSNWLPMTGDVDNGNGTRSFLLSSLTAGSTYQIKVAASNVLGRGTASTALSLTAQLVDLDALADTYLSVGTINLVTQNQNNLPYTYTADPSSVCTVSGTTLTLVSTGTCTITQDQAGDANNLPTTATASFDVLANPVVQTVPGAPQSLTATPAPTQVTLSWATPASDGGASVTDYVVQYKVGTNWIPFTDGVNTSTSVVITGLTNGTSYDFKVAAVNSVGQGNYTSAVTSSPATVAGAATSLSGTKSGTSATLTWTAPGSNGGSAITDYKVSYKLTTSPTWTLFADGVSSSTGATITGLDGTASYDYQVEVVNAAGVSPAVSTVTLVATNGNAQVGLSWTAPNTGGATILDYVIEYRLAGESSWTAEDTQATSTTATLGSLTNGSAYDVRVAAMVSDGNGGQVASSYTSTVRVNPFSVPAAPSLIATPGIKQIALSWTAPSSNGAAITDYVIEYKLTSDSSWTTLADGTSVLTYAMITNLTNGSSYDVRAKAVNSAGQSGYSTIVSTTPRTVPGTISGLTLTAGPAALTLSWTAPISDGGAAITDYQIQYRLLSSLTWVVFGKAPSTDTEVTVPNLAGLSNYSVRVAAVNPAGVGPFGPAGSEITLAAPVVATPPPSSPTEPEVVRKEIKLELAPVANAKDILASAPKVSAGGQMSVAGSNFDRVDKVMVGSDSVPFTFDSNNLKFALPEKLSLMAYQTTIISNTGEVVAGPLVDVTEVKAVIGGQDALLRRLPNGEIKVWVFDPLATGKIQYFLRGREIAWVRPDLENADEKLRTLADGTDYLVRTLRVTDSEIADFELWLDGRRVELFTVEGRTKVSAGA